MKNFIKAPDFPELLPSFENPWTTLATKEIYKNPWITLREDRVITPADQPGIYSVVDTRIATAIVALDRDNNIYLVGQYRYPINLYSWEVIEGGSEGAQSALHTAERELVEEAGLQAKNWQQIGNPFYLSNCFSSEVGYIFLATDLEEVPSQPDSTEQLTLTKIPFSQALKRVQSGEISDAMSIIAINRVDAYLKNI